MKVDGTVRVRFEAGEGEGVMNAILEFAPDGGDAYYTSDPVQVGPGNMLCFGPVASAADLEAQFSYETYTAARAEQKAPEQKTPEEEAQRASAQKKAAGRPGRP